MRRSRCLAASLAGLLACSGGHGGQDRWAGQTSFESSIYEPPGEIFAGPRPLGAYGVDGNQPAVYRVEGNRLYTLDASRGLLVFDIAEIDHPRLIGRSAVLGWPVALFVRGTIVTLVMTDWYGNTSDGAPFYGSVVRALDVADLSAIRFLGEVEVPGWISEVRVVGDVLYTASLDLYVRDDVARLHSGEESAVVTSMLFGGVPQKLEERRYPHADVAGSGASMMVLRHFTDLIAVDIADPGGHIVERGTISLPGVAPFVDLSDGQTLRALQIDGLLTLFDLSAGGPPALVSQVNAELDGWRPSPLFDAQRMYLFSTPSTDRSFESSPFLVYDLSAPAAPRVAAEITIAGRPAGARLIGSSMLHVDLAAPAICVIDLSDVAHPSPAASVPFDQGWTWRVIGNTFKAPVLDASETLVAVPFSAWDDQAARYRAGVQLLQRTSNSITGLGIASTGGPIDGGVFVGGRLVTLSDSALSVLDVSSPSNPAVIAEVTLAQDVVRALPVGDYAVELTEDFWRLDPSATRLRVLPLSAATDPPGAAELSELPLDGWVQGAFANGEAVYVITYAPREGACVTRTNCVLWGTAVHVFDVSGGVARERGQLALPGHDEVPRGERNATARVKWLDGEHSALTGDNIVQVDKDLLALVSRVQSVDATQLVLVDLAVPDAPRAASMTIDDSGNMPWGNLVAQSGALYLTEEESLTKNPRTEARMVTRDWADRIDTSDRAHPRIASRVNVSGIVRGVSPRDPSILYVSGYRWGNEGIVYSFDVLRVEGSRATLLGFVDLDGLPGRFVFEPARALVSISKLHSDAQNFSAAYWGQTLHEIDLSNSSHPSDHLLDARETLKWLVGVHGDLAFFTSGWQAAGTDVYRLSAAGPPVYDRFLRGTPAISSNGDDLLVALGTWGVEPLRSNAAAR